MRLRAFCTFFVGLAVACGGGGDTNDGGDAGNPNDGAEGGCEKCVDAPTGGPTTVTVLNASGTALVSFPLDASGDVAPSATISGNQTNLAQSIAVGADAQGELFVATPLAILVFAPGASGNVAPARTIAGPNALASTDEFAGVAVAPDGTVYAAAELASGTTRSPKIDVFAPGANGNVAPTRTIGGPTTTMQAVLALALGPSEIAEADGSLNVDFFDPSASGDVAPSRTLKSPQGIAEGLAVDGAGSLYIAEYMFSASEVVAYAPGAQGTAAPVATITGSSTGITAVGGVAAAPDGTLFVTNADPAGASIRVFSPGANGNVAPARAIAGATTTLSGDASQYPMPLVVF